MIPAGTRPTLTGTVTLGNNTAVRAVNFSGAAPAMSASGLTQAVAIDQVNVTGGTNALSMLNVSGSVTVTNANFTNTTGAELLISGGTGSVSVGATISSNAGQSINIQNRTGGTVTFTGAITDTGLGVFLNANTGSTINFSGGLALSTTTSPGFTATGGGTVSATQNNTTIVNSITTTTGTALNVANTTIGASGLTFRSISAGTGAAGPTSGIILNSTGTGNFTVTGDGVNANSGGTIQRTAGSPGALIQGGNGAIDLTSANGTKTFQFMRIFAPGGNGLMVTNSTGTTSMDRSTIDHNSAVIANSFAVRLENHSGNATLTMDGVTVQNKMDGSTSVSVSTQDTASATFNVIDTNTGDTFVSLFTNLFGSGIVVGVGDNAGANGTVP